MTIPAHSDASHEMRTLSIIVPARNAERTLPALLDDLLQLSTPVNWQVEFIVAYTKSADRTLDVITSRAVGIAHCSVIGPSAARNVGVASATGECFYFIDADARPVGADFLHRLLAKFEQLEASVRLGGFGGPVLLEPSQRANPIAQADHFACWFNWTRQRSGGPTTLFQPTVSLLLTREVFEALNGFDEDIRVLEDYDFHLRALAAGYEFHYCPRICISHHARSTLFKSWRHSWYWGLPYRSAYVEKSSDAPLPISSQSNWFWLNLPPLFLKRMRLVLRSARRESVSQMLLTSPFIAITVFAWALAAASGKDQPADEKPHAE